MQDEIREQMNRYPVFSCNEMSYIDESDLFKDEQIHSKNKKTNQNFISQTKKKNQTIISIYDRIACNNESDPLYPKRMKSKNHNYSTVTSARHSKQNLQKQKTHKNNTLTKFVGQFAKSISHENSQINDFHQIQKISLLRRIIDHYNIKSVEKKYYSNLIKTFGLKIQSFNSSEIAVKKDLHPRINPNTRLPQQVPSIQGKDVISPKKSIVRKFKQSTSFSIAKEDPSFQISKQLSTSQHNRAKNIRTSKCHSRQMLRQSIEIGNKMVQRPLKMQNSGNSIQHKLNKYRDFLFILNLSNHLYRNLDIKQYQKPFKFYVGRGNNGNLIKSLMKKRFWFEQTSSSSQANFFWTQIKLEIVFEKQESQQQKSPNEEKIEQNLILENGNDVCQPSQSENSKSKEQLVNQENKISFKTKNKISKFHKNKATAKSFEPIDPILKICQEKDAKDFANMKNAMNYKKNPTFADRLRYLNQKTNLENNIENTILHNHLPVNGLLGNKKAMFYNIREYCKLTKKQLLDYVPLTFHIKNGLLDEEYKQLSQIYNERKKKNLPNYWIIKPGEFSNRGQGISCTSKLEQIRRRISKCKQMTSKAKLRKSSNSQKSKDATLIIQLYIHNPLLYNYRKFDIRAFMMVTIHNGKIKGYWYQEGYVRTSSFIWTLSEIQDKYIHLTNDAVQKNCEEYGLFQPGNKISYAELQRYLNTLPTLGRNLDFFKVIYPKMRSMATDMIKSTFINLDPARKRDNFEIFGLDFMIDHDFKPWLIEVNTNPCLEMSCPILERIIPYMVENAFRIGLDPLFPPPSSISQDYKYAIPENALHYNKFELIFDEDRDGPPLKKLYKDSTIRTHHNLSKSNNSMTSNRINRLSSSKDKQCNSEIFDIFQYQSRRKVHHNSKPISRKALTWKKFQFY